jgi:hypothetical protein
VGFYGCKESTCGWIHVNVLSPPLPQLTDESRAAAERQQTAIAELQQQHARALQRASASAGGGSEAASRMISSAPSPGPSEADSGA